MKSLVVTLGILFLLGFSTQLLRHVHARWIAPTTSVLDAYRDETDKDIAASTTLEELHRQYEETHREWKERGLGKTDKEKHGNERWWELNNSENKLRQAIESWEQRSREIGELHFFWWSGFLCAAAGLICFLRSAGWLAIGLIIAGFTEMLYWTSPPWRFFSGSAEFERLLFWKTVYTAAGLALLLVFWGYFARYFRRIKSCSDEL